MKLKDIIGEINPMMIGLFMDAWHRPLTRHCQPITLFGSYPAKQYASSLPDPQVAKYTLRLGRALQQILQ
ncbi:hypothetical protein [Mesorhizobium sangaii]|uniref:Uncharacterized protein n=1 Tax=Mesorhizobium sangaii TaxID=505389 RepID=A0A841PK55_9HYPH|nr:hypothetical protein [Mesorhizobium sangaii]MBB6414421.1 hypothetical protein [Mesorhizobium sangaii]